MFSLDIDSLTLWISNNPDWALWVVFAISFIESLAVIGLLMPGWLLLMGVGVLIGTGNINFYLASIYCFFGAVIGEYISYIVGVHYQEKVHHWGVFKRNPHWIIKTEHFFQRYGTASIALGRFVGPVRAFVPLIAGMSAMPTARFQVTNILSAMIWAPVYLTPGILLGASVQIDDTVRWFLLGNIIVIAVSGWTLVSYLKNSWYLREHTATDNENHDYKNVVIKILLALIVFISATIYIFLGPHHQQLLLLMDLFWQIVNR